MVEFEDWTESAGATVAVVVTVETSSTPVLILGTAVIVLEEDPSDVVTMTLR
jgi:hypothetical protein